METSAASAPARRRPALPGSARLLGLASDGRLVEHVRGGSEPAFEAIFDRHHRAILSFCRHMLASAEEAEDVVQHTFMAAYRDLVSSEKDIQLRAWLYAIARNRCLSVLRARRERPLGEFEEPSTENLSSEVQRRQDLRDLLSDLAGLPDDQRAALVLAEVGDVSHDEIALVLDVEREKVKALVFQARTSLSASRKARETPCQEIREQLANLRGGSLRRTTLRRHVRECAGCREFRDAVGAQRKALAIVLPVAPTLALKETALAAAFSGGAGAAGGAAVGGGTAALVGATASGGGGALAAKALVVVALAGGGATAGVTAARDDGPATPSKSISTPSSGTVVPSRPPASSPGAVPAVGVGPGAGEGTAKPGTRTRTRTRSRQEAERARERRAIRAERRARAKAKLQTGRKQRGATEKAGAAPRVRNRPPARTTPKKSRPVSPAPTAAPRRSKPSQPKKQLAPPAALAPVPAPTVVAIPEAIVAPTIEDPTAEKVKR